MYERLHKEANSEPDETEPPRKRARKENQTMPKRKKTANKKGKYKHVHVCITISKYTCTCKQVLYAKSLYNLITEKKIGSIIVVGSTTPSASHDSQPRQTLRPPLPSLCPPEPDREWFKNNDSICSGTQSPLPSSPPPVTPSSSPPVTPSSLPPATSSPSLSPSLDQSNNAISESGKEFNLHCNFFNLHVHVQYMGIVTNLLILINVQIHYYWNSLFKNMGKE